jgi:Tfp pilus assembly ATPase PilU
MQTSTQRGMQTMEHGLTELIRKHTVTVEAALAVSSRKEQLIGMLERSGISVNLNTEPPATSGLRIAGSG